MEDTLERLADSVDVVFSVRNVTENEAECFGNQEGLVSFQVPYGDDLESFECLHDLSKAIGNDSDTNVGFIIKEDDSGSKLELLFEPRESPNVESHLNNTTKINEQLVTETAKMGLFLSKYKAKEGSADSEQKALDSVLDTSSAQTADSSEEYQQAETAQHDTPDDHIGQETHEDEDVVDGSFDNALPNDRPTVHALRRRPKRRVQYSPDGDDAPKVKVRRKPKKLVVHRPGNRKRAVQVKLETSSSGLLRCPLCPREFVTRIEYERHVARAHIEASMFRTYGCNTCGKQFKTAHYLENHQRTHTGERPYGCPHCPKNFSQSGNLQTHIRHIHTGERPFGCTLCGKRFLQKSNLDQHFRLHTGVRPYGCDQCGMRFTQGSGLYYHKNNCSGIPVERR